LYELSRLAIREGLNMPGSAAIGSRRSSANDFTLRRSIARIVVLTFMMLGILAVLDILNASAGGVAPPELDDPLATNNGQRTAVLAGGCFWGMQLLFEHVEGVLDVKAGYSGGSAKTADYELVSTGSTGHAESVRVVYDPSKVTYGALLEVYFTVGHDPTELNRQGPDDGTQYRSVIFYTDQNQQRIAEAYVAQLTEAKAFKHRIVTQIVPLEGFYQAESYHQDYAIHNPFNPYILVNDFPKVDRLQKQFPDLYVKNR
jgi:peptide-methionine (S)-S-oxide reductase